MELEESIEEVSAERDQIKNELEEGKNQFELLENNSVDRVIR